MDSCKYLFLWIGTICW